MPSPEMLDKSKPFCIVTGAGGFIGSCLCDMLHESGYRYIAIAKNPLSKWPNKCRVQSKGSFLIRGDVSSCDWMNNYDVERILRDEKNFTIFHLASEVTAVQPSFGSLLSVSKSIHSLSSVIDLAARFSARIVFFSSQLAVHRGTSPYATMKYCCEQILRNHYKKNIIVRIPSVYGNGNFKLKKFSAGVVGIFLESFSNRCELNVYDQSSIKRTFSHVSDICKSILSLDAKENEGKTISITGEEFSAIEIANLVYDNKNDKHKILPISEKFEENEVPGENTEELKIKGTSLLEFIEHEKSKVLSG